MTVPAQESRNVSTAAPGATVFPYDFKILDQGDLLVQVDNATKSVDVDFTVDGVGTEAGGNITFLTPLAGGETVMRKRSMAYSRTTDYQNLGDLRSPTLNNDQDAPVMMLQQLADEVSRCLRLSDSAGSVDPLGDSLIPLAPIVLNADGNGFSSGDTTMTGDMLLRPNLAAGTDNLFQQLGTGAILRGFLSKLRERITPEDFGAIGDGTDRPVSQWLSGGARDRGFADLAGIQTAYPHVSALTDSIDWAGFQAAVNYCKLRSVCVRATGQYAHNRKLTVDAPVSIIGDHWGEFSTAANASAGNAKGAKITATASMTSIVEFYAGANTYLRGGVFTGFLLNAAGLAEKCFYSAGASKCIFVGLYGFAATTYGFDFSDDGNRGCFDNKIDQISYNWNNNAAADTSIGFIFRDAMQGGCVQNEVGRVYTSTNNGDGIVIGGCDNNNFYSIGGFVSGTGMGIRFSNGIGSPPLRSRNNQVHYAAGKVYFESATYGNRIHRMSSENSAIFDDSGGKNWWTMFDYNSAYTAEYAFEPSLWSDVLTIPVGGMQAIGGASLVTASSTVAAWELADGSTQGVSASVLAPKKWGRSGAIKAITVCYVCSTGGTGNIRFTISGAAAVPGGSIAATSTNSFTQATPGAANTMQKVTFTFTTPITCTAGRLVQIAAQRIGADGADSYTGTVRILSIGIHYVSDGPSFPAVPGWGVTDPTI